MCGAAGQESVCAVVTGPVPCPSQSWADAFRSSPDLTGVVAVYEDLRRKGLEFPMTDLDMLSPIHTPQRVSRADGLGWGEGVSLLPISPGPDQPRRPDYTRRPCSAPRHHQNRIPWARMPITEETPVSRVPHHLTPLRCWGTSPYRSPLSR